LATNFDDGSDHAEPTLVKIERIGAETGRLSPSKSGTASGHNDGAVPIGHSREQAVTSSSRVMIRSSALCFVEEATGCPRRVECQQTVTYCRPEDGVSELVTLGDDIR
jgi:hypothetical protein